MSARRKGNSCGATWHPAKGSRLTLADAMTDPPALPPRRIADYPDVGDAFDYLTRNVGRYVQAVEELAEQARKQGDVRTQVRALRLLAHLSKGLNKSEGRAAPDTGEDPDLSGLSDEELRRLIDRKANES